MTFYKSLECLRPLGYREELERRAGEMLGLIASGKLKLRIDKTFPLEEAGEAHRYLEGRKSRGKILLIP